MPVQLYLNELAPWERKKEYYNQIQVGKDVKNQTEAISKSTKAMIATQIMSANYIIASQDAIKDGIDNLAYGIDRVEQGMAGLQAAFEWGIAEVVWQIEQNRQVLRTILEVLSAPLDTQAKELRKRAEEAYANGWFDDALDDFLESEKKNRYDFSIHISLGMIYLFNKTDKTKAMEYFEKAAKYARPKSSYHASFALLHAALIKRDENKLEDAERLTAEAIELSPDFAEAFYQNAQYNAQLKNSHKCISNLEKAIKIDKNYCIKADHDEMFNTVRDEVNYSFKRLRDEIVTKAEDGYKALIPIICKIDEIVTQAIQVQDDIEKFNTNNFSADLSEVRRLLNRKTVFDGLDAQEILQQTFAKVKKYIEVSENSFQRVLNKLDRESKHVVENSNYKSDRKKDNYKTNGQFTGAAVILIVGFIIGMLTHPKSNNFWFVTLYLCCCLIGFIVGGYIGEYMAKSTSDKTSFEANEFREKKTILEEQIINLQKISLLCDTNNEYPNART